jgi:hypothetical protein
MNPDRNYVVITTIQEPNVPVRRFAEKIAGYMGVLVIVGDRKGPASFDLENALFLSLQDQIDSEFALAKLLPENHYSRKNIGYLAALTQGASCIYETDDDNAPMEDWKMRIKSVKAAKVIEKGWVNAYRFFSEERIWPRGFPLDEIAVSEKALIRGESCEVDAPIQQGLADNSPDVDAIWRLLLDRPFTFRPGPSIYLAPGSWCPFNSQSTWWWPEAFPLMYLPSYCSFRMTDIWRGFIAQRCLWEMGYGVVFHASEVIQERNEHNLMRDFNDEVPGYIRNKELVEILEGLSLKGGTGSLGGNVLSCYEALVTAGFFPEKELGLVHAWLQDLTTVKEIIARKSLSRE